MNNIYDTLALLWGGILRPTPRHLGLVVLAAVGLSATSCGGSSASTAATGAPASSIAHSTAAPTSSVAHPAATPTWIVPVAPAAATETSTTSPRPSRMIDELIGAPGERVHLRCVGQGDTTVLLLSGFGGDLSGWATVEPAIAARARVCSYDRPGTGTSDPPTSVASFTTQAAELHSLLDSIGEAGPYVVVGHSFGGAEAVTFASLFADEVIGLVLVDASPTTWPAAVCAVPDDGSDGAATLRGVCAMFDPAGNVERLDATTAFAEAARIVTLGSLPMAVITAVRRELPADLAASEADRLNAAWNQGQQDWLALSTEAHLVVVEETGHHIEIDRPGVVIDEITRLLP